MKKTITLAIFLAVFSAVSGLALAAVNDLTSPIIEEAKIAAEQENLVKIFSSGEKFKQLDDKVEAPLTAVFEASKDGSATGYVYKGTTKGYGGDVVFLIGITKDGNFKDFVVLEASGETKGIGSKITEDKFKEQFIDKSLSTKVDTISGATVTSKPVVEAIASAVAHFNANYK